MANTKPKPTLESRTPPPPGPDLPDLTPLLDAWRQTRSPELADLITKLTPPPAKRIYPKSIASDDKQRRWLAAAKLSDVALLPALLELIHDGYSTDIEARVAALASWPADPRVADVLTRLYESPAHFNISTLPMWERIAEVLVRLDDPRTLPRLDAVAALGDRWVTLFKPHMRPLIPQHLAKLRQRLAATSATWPVLTAPQRALLHARRPPPSPDELLAAIYARPDDDAARLVYADFLTEQGDPRGEFISLQCQAAPTKAQQKRAWALLAEHRVAWVGKLRQVVLADSVVFERGFPAWVELKFDLRVRDLGGLVGAAIWATVHTIRLAGAYGTPLPLVTHPGMTGLRRVELLSAEDARRLARAAQPLSWQTLSVYFENNAATIKALEQFVGLLPQLRELFLIADRNREPREAAAALAARLVAARPSLRVTWDASSRGPSRA